MNGFVFKVGNKAEVTGSCMDKQAVLRVLRNIYDETF